MASNNDGGVREYDMERFQLMNHFRFPWPVNVSFLHTLFLFHFNNYRIRYIYASK